MMENLKLEREQSKDQMSDLVKAIANIPPPVGKSISRFHTRRRTSRLDQQLVSVADKSSDVKTSGTKFPTNKSSQFARLYIYIYCSTVYVYIYIHALSNVYLLFFIF
jgi:hypothetical protein